MRSGDGPGESRSPRLVVMLPGDSVGLLDMSGRFTVFGAGGKPSRSTILPIRNVYTLLIHTWPTRVLVNGLDQTPDRIGWEFHLMDMSSSTSRNLKSFGMRKGNLPPGSRGTVSLRHTLSRIQGTNEFWAAPVASYQFSKLNNAGDLLSRVSGTPHWFRGESRWTLGGPAAPPDPRIEGVQQDGDGHLWVYGMSPSPDWRTAWEGIPVPSKGIAEIDMRNVDYEALFVSRIDIFDLRTSSLLVSAVVPNRLISILPNNMIAVSSPTDDATPRVSILKLRVEGLTRKAGKP